MTTPLAQPAARQLWAALRMLVVMTVLLGLAYPLAMTGFAQVVFPGRADGSLVERDGTVGRLVTDRPVLRRRARQYFQSRPSAAGDGYDPLASSASNLGPENQDLIAAIEERRQAAAALDGTDPGEVAPDALLASGSGLDPHISPEYAEQQVARVARERGLSDGRRARARRRAHRRPQLGFLGEPRVNVLQLNLALDEAAGAAD